MKRVLIAAAAALAFVPATVSAAVVHGDQVSMNLSITVTSAFLPDDWSITFDNSDAYCVWPEGGGVDQGCLDGAEIGREYDFSASQEGLNIETTFSTEFTEPSTPGWGWAYVLNYVQVQARIRWENYSDTAQTASWRVDYFLTEDEATPFDRGYESVSDLNISGVGGCDFFSPEGPASGFFNCSRTLAPGEAFSLSVLTMTASNLYVEEFDISPVPLPAALPLLAVGLGGLGFIGRPKRKAA